MYQRYVISHTKPHTEDERLSRFETEKLTIGDCVQNKQVPTDSSTARQTVSPHSRLSRPWHRLNEHPAALASSARSRHSFGDRFVCAVAKGPYTMSRSVLLLGGGEAPATCVTSMYAGCLDFLEVRVGLAAKWLLRFPNVCMAIVEVISA